EWKDNGATFIEVSCWRRLAENVCDSLGKGSPVIVTGRLRSRERDIEVEGGRTERRTFFEIEATNVGPDLMRCATRAVDRRTEPVARQEDIAVSEALGIPSGSPFEPVPGEPMPETEVPAA
ncbi:MAG: single-stranded DNA-binding protein, partial [Candidatus Nanopelagicales bacterium]